jgi:hypothetical protein
MLNVRAHLLPILAVAGGTAAAIFGLGVQKSPAAAPVELKPAAPSMPAAPIPDDDQASTQTISGEVLERISVEKYTYLRLGERGSAGTWTAVPAADVKEGERVRVGGAQHMTQFVSTTLKRTFDSIYFGVLEPGSGLAAASGSDSTGAVNPHATPGAAVDAIDVSKVARAPGPLGRTVAELNDQRLALAGKTARVRAVVVKSTTGVLGRNFLHVRDRSGDGKAKNNDLVVTTTASATLGQNLLFEGTVVNDKDFGAGYRYPVILEDARLLEPERSTGSM